jgi:hypothetical protein
MGNVQFVPVPVKEGHPPITVANMVAQGHPSQQIPIRYEALRIALEKVAAHALEIKAKVHMPKIGTGLARGDWKFIQEIIEQELCSKGIEVFVYEKRQEN